MFHMLGVALCCPVFVAGTGRKISSQSLTPNFDSVSGVNRFRSVPGLPFYPPERDCTTLDIIMVHPQQVSAYLTICCTPGTHRALHTRLCYFTLSTSLFFTQQTLE